MKRLQTLLLVPVLALQVWGCDKKHEDEDADAGPDVTDSALDPTDDDAALPDTLDDPADDPVEETTPDAVEDPVEDPVEEDAPVVSGRIAFTVTPAAEGLGGTAVQSESNPESIVFESDTATTTHTPGTNGVFIDAASLGLASVDDVDAISFLAGPPPYAPTFHFSVEDLASHQEGAGGTDVRHQSTSEDDPGDVYTSTANDDNTIVFDEVSVGLTPDPAGGTPKDDLNGLHLDPPTTASGIVYFSVKPGAAGLADTAVDGAAAADLPGTIFMSGLDGNNEVAFTRVELGLAENDDVDGIVVFGTGATAQYAHFSVTSGSLGTPGTAVDTERGDDGAAGDVFGSAGTGFNTLVADAPWLGLLPEDSVDQDEMDALYDTGPTGGFDVPITPITGEGLHSFDGKHHPFLRGSTRWAVADFTGQRVMLMDGSWSLVDTWDFSTGDSGVLDVAVSPTGDYMAACTEGGLATTCFPTLCMTMIASWDPCTQVIAHRGFFWAGTSSGTSHYLEGIPEDGGSSPVSTSLGARPWGIAAFGDLLYVVADPGSGAGTLVVFDVSGDYPAWQRDASLGNGPRFVALNATGTTAIVSNSTDGTAWLIDTATGGLDHNVAVGANPFGVAAVGNVAAVANYDDSTVSIVDMETGTVLDTIDVTGCSPGFMKRVPGTTLVATACYTSSDLTFIDLSAYL